MAGKISTEAKIKIQGIHTLGPGGPVIAVEELAEGLYQLEKLELFALQACGRGVSSCFDVSEDGGWRGAARSAVWAAIRAASSLFLENSNKYSWTSDMAFGEAAARSGPANGGKA